MGSDTRFDASASYLRAPRFAWPALVLALAFGAVEWLALARSRGADRIAAFRHALRHR
jgi:hypothetical protein